MLRKVPGCFSPTRRHSADHDFHPPFFSSVCLLSLDKPTLCQVGGSRLREGHVVDFLWSVHGPCPLAESDPGKDFVVLYV